MKEWFRNGRYIPAAERLPPRPCGCGKCGLTIPRTLKHGARRWAVGCPNYDGLTVPKGYQSRRSRPR